MKILSIGECMAEFSPDEQLGKFNLGFAGDTFNTAWYIANNHADVNSAYFSKVGDDELSDQMLKFMSDNQVDTTYIKTVALWVDCSFNVFNINRFSIKGATLPIKIAIANKNPSNSKVKAHRL